MKAEQFVTLVEQRCQKIHRVLASKGLEYSYGDRLSNFKRGAKFMERLPASVCLAFATKHLVSIFDGVDEFEKTKKATDLPSRKWIDEKIGDAINYLILLEAILVELNDSKDQAEGLPEKS